MNPEPFRVALVRDTFFGTDAAEHLERRLLEARDAGAELCVLPEIPLNPWSPATRVARDDDAEPPSGPRHRMLAAASARAGVGVVGGAIVADPATGRRHNTALVFDAGGELVATYAKVHLPDEDGFREADHYEAADAPPARIDAFGMPIGVQLCSDMNRPTGCLVLGALGCELIVAPRATEAATWERWRLVLRANAITSCCHVLSVPRPEPEGGVLLGGPSVAFDPNGELLLETEEQLAVVALGRDAVCDARRRYPGYLVEPAELYARGWSAVARSTT